MPDIDNKFDDEALLQQLGGVSHKMQQPGDTQLQLHNDGWAPPDAAVVPEGAAPGRRGWGNLNLDAPQQRGINAFEGYNDDRALSGGDDDSVKDGLRRWLGGLDFDLKGKTKEQIGDFYKSQLGNARDYGLDIRDVQGEKVLINTKERGPEWIDTVMRAGGDNPAFGYISDFDTTGQLLPDAPSQQRVMAAPMAQGPSALDQILEEINALTQGATSPMETQSLLELLQP